MATRWEGHTAHLIDSEVNAGIGDDPHKAGGDASVKSPRPLTLQDLPAAVSHASVVARAAQRQTCL